jgi:hypothetical protein
MDDKYIMSEIALKDVKSTAHLLCDIRLGVKGRALTGFSAARSEAPASSA